MPSDAWKAVAASPAEITPHPRVTAPPADGSTDWAAFRRAAEERHGPGLMGLYLLQDERLIAGGMPPTPPWWTTTYSDFIESELTWLLVLAGRGMGKSTFLERLLLLFVMWTPRVVPPGQPWTCPFMSVVERDAAKRIYELRELVQMAYRCEATIKGQSVAVVDACGNKIEILSTAGTIGQTSGATTTNAFFDEAAKMHTAPGAAHLDTELIASIVGTSRELKGWRGVRCSSAWETRGAHFASCMEGTNAENFVATIGPNFVDAALAGYEEVARFETAQGNSHGAAQIRAFAKTLTASSPNVATWVGRPTLTAIMSRMKLETLPKDDPTLEGLSRFEFWIREYGSMPLSREGGADIAGQCQLAAAITARLNGRPGPLRRDPTVTAERLLVNPSAPPGDARYGGPKARERPKPGGWRRKTI